jgi:hypothetical protein
LPVFGQNAVVDGCGSLQWMQRSTIGDSATGILLFGGETGPAYLARPASGMVKAPRELRARACGFVNRGSGDRIRCVPRGYVAGGGRSACLRFRRFRCATDGCHAGRASSSDGARRTTGVAAVRLTAQYRGRGQFAARNTRFASRFIRGRCCCCATATRNGAAAPPARRGPGADRLQHRDATYR